MSLSDMFKSTTKTTIKTTLNGKEVTGEQQEAFDKLWSSFDDTMKSFNTTMEVFSNTVSKTMSQSDEVELYGSSKEDVLSKTEKYSIIGYKLIDLNEKDNFWVAKMKK